MLVAQYVLLAVAVLGPLNIVYLYNRLVRSRNLVEEGWSGIDAQLKRRADLVPNLVSTVKGNAAREKGVLEKVIDARARATWVTGPDRSGAARNALTDAPRQLFAVAENFPALKADENFRRLQERLASLADEIQKARRPYNAAVRRLGSSLRRSSSLDR